MSKALRCDRCKTCFDPYSQEKDFATIKDFMLQDGGCFDRHECSYRDEELNLCPKCTELFGKFMSGKVVSDTEETTESTDDKDSEWKSLEEMVNEFFETRAYADLLEFLYKRGKL